MFSYNFFTNKEESLQKSKADFLLITTLDENLSGLVQRVKEEKQLFSAELITLATNRVAPFSKFEFVNLNKLSLVAQDAKHIFKKGMAFAESYDLRGNYLLLAQDSKNINAAKVYELLQTAADASVFETLSFECDETLIFAAGFILQASRRFHIVLGGGMEMALVLLICDMLREETLMRVKSQNITYATTSFEHTNKEIHKILQSLSYTPHALYTSLDLTNAEIQEIKKIETTEQKNRLGAGASLAYLVANALSNKTLLEEMELVIYTS